MTPRDCRGFGDSEVVEIPRGLNWVARSLAFPALAVCTGLLVRAGAFSTPDGYPGRGWYLLGPYFLFCYAVYHVFKIVKARNEPAILIMKGFVEVNAYPRSTVGPPSEFVRSEFFEIPFGCVIRCGEGWGRPDVT